MRGVRVGCYEEIGVRGRAELDAKIIYIRTEKLFSLTFAAFLEYLLGSEDLGSRRRFSPTLIAVWQFR